MTSAPGSAPQPPDLHAVTTGSAQIAAVVAGTVAAAATSATAATESDAAALPVDEALAAAGRIEMVIPYQLAGLEGADGRLSGVTVATLDGETRRLEADVLLAFFGLSMDLGPMQDWGIDLEKSHIRADPATCQTNLGGIYAIGDIATYPGKLKLILTGFSEAAMAAHAAFPRVHPDEILHFEHSTTTGIPAAA